MKGRPFLLGILSGILLIHADNYFGNGDGALAFLVLGALLLGSMLIEFVGNLHLIRHPRTLDFLFVGGATRERRIAISVRSVLESAKRQPVVPSIGIVVIGIAKGYGPGFIAAIVGSIILEAALICGLLVGLLKSGKLPVSRKRYSGSGTPLLGFFGTGSGALIIASTYSLAKMMSGFLRAPHRWLIRRRLLVLFRVDPVFNLIYSGFILILAATLSLQWNGNIGAAFSVVGTLLTLTLIQIATAEYDSHFRVSPFLPGGRIECRSRLGLYVAVAALFSAFYATASLYHGGVPGADSAIGFLQTLVTCVGFPFLLLAGEPGREWTMNNRLLMNSCYLGLSGCLFIFGGTGLGAALVVLAWAAYGCYRICGPA